jgi:hypothetical protein
MGSIVVIERGVGFDRTVSDVLVNLLHLYQPSHPHAAIIAMEVACIAVG